MKTYPFNLSLALLGGVALASMIAFNSQLAAYSSPLLASWFAHGLGAIVAFLIVIAPSVCSGNKFVFCSKLRSPIWAYLGGIPGAFTVFLAAITVNSPLGLSGSIAFIMAGQVLFGIVSDAFGLFGLMKRRIAYREVAALVLIIVGCLITLFGRG